MKEILICVVLLFVSVVVSPSQAGNIDMEKLQSIPNIKVLGEGILGGGRPTMDDLKELKQQGFKTVIDLRTKWEMTIMYQKNVEKIGLFYFNIPVKSSVNAKQARELSTILENPDNLPVLIHCAVGGRVDMLWEEYSK